MNAASMASSSFSRALQTRDSVLDCLGEYWLGHAQAWLPPLKIQASQPTSLIHLMQFFFSFFLFYNDFYFFHYSWFTVFLIKMISKGRERRIICMLVCKRFTSFLLSPISGRLVTPFSFSPKLVCVSQALHPTLSSPLFPHFLSPLSLQFLLSGHLKSKVLLPPQIQGIQDHITHLPV